MAKPRIRWSFDGTLGYTVSGGVKTAFTATEKSIADGDKSVISKNSWGTGTLVFNFPDTISIDRIGFKQNNTGTVTIKVSTDSTDGIDGNWTTKITTSAITADIYTEFSWTASNATWLKIDGLNANYVYCCHLFGEYQNPRFEFWDAAGSAELTTAQIPLAFTTAGNAADISEALTFKIKNTTAASHDYSLTVSAARYGGDAPVTDHVLLSTNGGTNKAATVTVTGLAAGALSGTISLYLDMTVAHNPADGAHYGFVHVTETA
jgi:hypothetical protein